MAELHTRAYKEDLEYKEESNRIMSSNWFQLLGPRFIGLSGSHRSGKTSLAEELSKKLCMPFIRANVGNNPVWDIVDFRDTISFAERIEVQERILSDFILLLESKNGDKFDSFIVDRTPIDILSYLLCNIDSTTSQLFDDRVRIFIEKCLNVTTEYFTSIFVVQPGIPFEKIPSKNGKIYNSRTYQEVLTSVIVGQFYRSSIPFNLIPRSILSLQERVDWVSSKIL